MCVLSFITPVVGSETKNTKRSTFSSLYILHSKPGQPFVVTSIYLICRMERPLKL